MDKESSGNKVQILSKPHVSQRSSWGPFCPSWDEGA